MPRRRSATGAYRRRRRRTTAAERAAVLRTFAASGLGVMAFCRQQGISRITFGRWRRGAAGRAPAFARVQLKEARATQPRGLTIVLRSPTGLSAEFTGLDGSTIETLLLHLFHAQALELRRASVAP